jgi:hypothetical protein
VGELRYPRLGVATKETEKGGAVIVKRQADGVSNDEQKYKLRVDIKAAEHSRRQRIHGILINNLQRKYK